VKITFDSNDVRDRLIFGQLLALIGEAFDDDDDGPAFDGAPDPHADPAAAFGTPGAAMVAAGQAPELDSAGFYWDARIHGGARNKTQDGKWKYKKGVPDSYKREVEAEIKRVLSGAGGAVAPAPLQPQGMPPAPVQPAMPANTAAPAAPASIPAAPLAVPVAGAAMPQAAPSFSADGIVDFPGLMKLYTAIYNVGRIDPTKAAAACAKYGAANLPAASQKPELIPFIAAELANIGNGIA